MIRLLIILSILPLFSIGQHGYNNRYITGPGEYNHFFVDVPAKRAYQIVNYPRSFVSAGLPDSFVTCSGGAHWSILLTAGGNVWTWGDSTFDTPTPARVATDSLGHVFSNVIKVGSGGTAGPEPWNFYALKSDGTLWVWKYTNAGVRGNGTIGGYSSLPVQIPFPAGTFITDAIVSFCGIALDSAGNGWLWGANPGGPSDFYAPYLLGQNCGSCTQPYNYANTPTKITFPGGVRCKIISGGSSLMNYFLLTNGQLYATAWHIGYIGLQSYSGHADMSYNNFLPIRVDTALKLQALIDTLVQTSLGEYAILTDSTLWFWGSNACANAGQGPGLNMRHYSGSNGYAPYAFDQGLDQAMTGGGINLAGTPVQCMPGKHNFTKIFGSTAVNYFTIVEDVHDSLYMAGRNKYRVQPSNNGYVDDSTAESLGNVYPNGLDINYWTYVNPFPTTNAFWSTCPICNDSAAANLCSTYPVNTSGSPPTTNAGTNGTSHTKFHKLNAVTSFSSPASGIKSRLWTNTSAPGNAIVTMPLLTSDTVGVSVTNLGVYQYQISVQDNNFKTASSTVIDTVGCANCCTRLRNAHHFAH